MHKQFKEAEAYILAKPYKDPQQTNSYRGINLISCLGKITKLQIRKLIMQHIEDNNSITRNQYSFMKNKSMEHALQRVAGRLYDLETLTQHTITVSLDIEAAFPTISHSAILQGCVDMKLPGHQIHQKLPNRQDSNTQRAYTKCKGERQWEQY